jgi:hypothetical protein
MTALPILELVPHVAAEPADVDDEFVAGSVGPGGEVVTLWVPAGGTGAVAASHRSGPFSFPDPTPSRPVPARVTVHATDGVAVVDLAELPVARPLVQLLPDGRVLVVGARCAWRSDGPERNAIVYDRSGEPVTSGTFGDGISHVLTTSGGEVWIGYSDEGVCGNLGWSVSEGRPPLGEAGLVRFSADLLPTWWYPERSATGDIIDCYALSATDDEVWICCHSGFPVVRIRAGVLTAWRGGVHGTRGLSVVDDRVAFFRTGHPRDPDVVVTGRPAGDEVVLEREFRLVLPGGHPLPGATSVARGSRTFVLTDGRAHRLDLADVPT